MFQLSKCSYITRHVSMNIADVLSTGKFHSQSRTTCFLSCFTSLLVDPVVEKQLIAATKEGTDGGLRGLAVKHGQWILRDLLTQLASVPQTFFGPTYSERVHEVPKLFFRQTCCDIDIIYLISSCLDFSSAWTLTHHHLHLCLSHNIYSLIHTSIHST